MPAQVDRIPLGVRTILINAGEARSIEDLDLRTMSSGRTGLSYAIAELLSISWMTRDISLLSPPA
jgi:hypothetical protein